MRIRRGPLAAGFIVLTLTLGASGCKPLEFESPAGRTAPAVDPQDAQRLNEKRRRAVEGQQWADRLRDDFLRRQDAEGQSGEVDEYGHRLMAWGAQEVGHLEISSSAGRRDDQEVLSRTAQQLIESLEPSVLSVTITILGTDISGYADRRVQT